MSEHTEWYTKPCSVHGHCLLIGPSTGKHEFSLQMPIETANLIATACNTHEKLLKRLKDAMCPYCNGPCGKRDPDQYHCRWCDETRVIIAAAGGE